MRSKENRRARDKVGAIDPVKSLAYQEMFSNASAPIVRLHLLSFRLSPFCTGITMCLGRCTFDSDSVLVSCLSLGVEIFGGKDCIATWTEWQVDEVDINASAPAAATIVSIMR